MVPKETDHPERVGGLFCSWGLRRKGLKKMEI